MNIDLGSRQIGLNLRIPADLFVVEPPDQRTLHLLALRGIDPHSTPPRHEVRPSEQLDLPADDEDPEEPGEHWRPTTRADCANVPRPCPYIGCRYHNVHTRGWLPADDDSVLRLVEALGPERSCALDVAEDHEQHSEMRHVAATTGDLGEIMGMTRQGAEQLVNKTVGKLVRHRSLRVVYEDSLDVPDETTPGYFGRSTPSRRCD